MKSPKILIAVDIEGVAGVWRPEQTRAGESDYERARRWMTQEADAAIRGAFAGGAGAVLVNDSHGHFGNLLADELDPRAELIQGKPRQLGMMAGVDQGVAGVLMIGWHARAKSRGVLAHTSNSAAFARVWLGGLELGEVGLYAALAGEFGVPVLMASGCDVMARARSGRSLSPASARALIEAAARDAVQGLGPAGPRGCSPWRLPGASPTLRVQCQTPALADMFALWPGVQREDAETIVVACATVQDAVRSLNALSVMATASR